MPKHDDQKLVNMALEHESLRYSSQNLETWMLFKYTDFQWCTEFSSSFTGSLWHTNGGESPKMVHKCGQGYY